MKWNEELVDAYYRKTAFAIPREIIYKFMSAVIQDTSPSGEVPVPGWWNFFDGSSNLTTTLYKYLSQCSGFSVFIPPFIEVSKTQCS